MMPQNNDSTRASLEARAALETPAPPIEPEFKTVQLREGCPTGCFDSNGIEIRVGDLLRREVTGNKQLHGPHAYHRVELRGLVPVLSYSHSERGQVLQPGYTGCVLSDLYDPSLFLFAQNRSDLLPCDEEVVIVPPGDASE